MDLLIDGDIVVVQGPLDARSTAVVRELLYDALPTRDLVLDLSQCEWLDATALRMLAAATRAAHRAGHRMWLRGCGPSVRRAIHVSGMRSMLDVEKLGRTA